MSDKEIHNNNQHAEDAEQVAPGLARPSIETIDTPGALLRHYRVERHVGLPELAAVLKVSPEKLDALENDRYDALPDMVFTRALAMSICRLLGVDSAAVMAKFPSINSPSLSRDSEGLNRPFKAAAQPAMSTASTREGSSAPKALLTVVGLLAAAAVVYFWPQIQAMIDPQESRSTLSQADANSTGSGAGGSAGVQSLQVPGLMALQGNNSTNSAENTNTEPFSAQLPAGPTEEESDAGLTGAAGATGTAAATGNAVPVASGATADANAAANAPANTAPANTAAANTAADNTPAVVADTIHIVAQEPVWVQIRDGANAIVHQSTLPKGRELSINNTPPLRVEIGRADAVQVKVKGQDFDLTPYARKNVARFEVTP